MKNKKGGGKRKRVQTKSRPERIDPVGVRNATLYIAEEKLRRCDGRAAGIKFNKLVFSIHLAFSKASNTKLHFTLPYRWYLYGAVVDTAELGGVIDIDHEEDEMRSTVRYRGAKPHVDPAVHEEIERICDRFCAQYPRTDRHDDMLRENYKSAKLDFQRAFLEWNILVQDMKHGSVEISNTLLRRYLIDLQRDFPEDLEPRLEPGFRRLAVYIEGLLSRPHPLRMTEVRLVGDLMWEFWSIFCLFLSIKYNEGISQRRLDGYRARSEEELRAYKRRLDALLEEAYLRDDTGGLDEETLKMLSSLLESRTVRALEEE